MYKIKTNLKLTCALILSTILLSTTAPVMPAYASVKSAYSPVYQDETGLPNGGLVFKMQGLQSGVPVMLGIKFNPNSDKSLNTQPDNYNDSAVTLRGEVYKKDTDTGKWTVDTSVGRLNSGRHYTSVVTAYPASNQYKNMLQVSFTPSDDAERIIVCKVLPTKGDMGSAYGDFTERDELSSRFNFKYSVGLLNTSNYKLESMESEEGVVRQVSGDTASCGELSDTDNPRDIWTLNLKYRDDLSRHEDGGINITFDELPSDFSIAHDFYFHVETAEKTVGSNGEPAFGYAKDDESDIIGGSVLGIDVTDGNQPDKPPVAKTVNVGHGSYGADIQIYEESTKIKISPTAASFIQSANFGQSDNFGRFEPRPKVDIYKFNYTFGAIDPDEYKVEVVEADTEFTYKDGRFTCNEPVSNDGKYQHNIKIKITENPDRKVNTEDKLTNGTTGLPNYGALITPNDETLQDVATHVTVTANPTANKSSGYVYFVVDYYIRDTSKMPYFRSIYDPDEGDDKYYVPDDQDQGLPANITGGDWKDFYTEGSEYFLASRNGIRAATWDNLDVTRMEKYYACKIGESIDIPVTLSVQNVEPCEYGMEDVEIKQHHKGRDDSESLYFKGVVDVNQRIPVIACVHPIASAKDSSHAPVAYDFDYTIKYGYDNGGYETKYALDKVSQTDNGKEYKRAGRFSSETFNIDSEKNKYDYNILYARYCGNKFDCETEPKVSPNILDEHPELNGTRGIQDPDGKYIGSFDLTDIKGGIILNIKDILGENSNKVAPYINIDLDTLDGDHLSRETSTDTASFFTLLGTVDESGKFTVKDSVSGDWINTYKSSYDHDSYYDIWKFRSNYSDEELSPKYTYTLHAHVQKDDVILIVPKNKYTEIKYSLSVRNYNVCNIDMINSNPEALLKRTVNNNIVYTGNTATAIDSGEFVQKLDLTFKTITSTNTATLTSLSTPVKKFPVSLIDYNVGSMSDFDISKQDSQFKFLFEPHENADAAVNMWRDTPYPNIVGYDLSNTGTPVFNYTTPFKDIFSIASESDENGNTKVGYKTNMELIYDENLNMYSYNSTLHAASYNPDKNVIEMYDSGFGPPGWGLKGAGFFPFNNFNDALTWGTADDYNLNVALTDRENIDYHFGMVLDTEFVMTENGITKAKDGTSQDTVFNFSGDDDVWVFIDGHLVLDLGGIHEAISGNINFADGTYTVNGNTYPLKARSDKDYGIVDWGTEAWAPYTTHRLSMFYLERGATISNCSLSFNVAVIDPPGDLKVSKTVAGTDGDVNKDFHFTVTLSDETVDGQYGDMTFTEGTADLTLKHGESAKATGLPSGITYEVTETEADQDGYTTEATGNTGTIPVNGMAEAEFVNTKDKAPVDHKVPTKAHGDLKVSKTVAGDGGDVNKDFHFTVTLSDETVDGKYGDMTFTAGTAEITLKHGESATATGLPSGITYEVTETEADQDGYTTTVNGGRGTIPVNGTAEAGFVNTRDMDEVVTPVKVDDTGNGSGNGTGIWGSKTGDMSVDILTWLIIFIVSIALILILLAFLWRRKA